jgi:signal transduction histidine kinase
MFRALPLFSWRQALLIVVPLCLLMPLAWLALRGEELATEREFRAVLEREPARFEARLDALIAEDLGRLEHMGTRGTVSVVGDYVHVAKDGTLLEPRATSPLSDASDAACTRLLHDSEAMRRARAQPQTFARECPLLRGQHGSLLAPFLLATLRDADALGTWLLHHRDRMRDEERDALARELERWNDKSAAQRLTLTLDAADRAIFAVQAPFEEERFRQGFNPIEKRIDLRTLRARIALTRLADGSYSGSTVHALSLGRPGALALFEFPRAIRMHLHEGALDKGAEPTATLAPELHVRFSLDREYVAAQSQRSRTLLRVWALALAAGIAAFALLLAYQGARAKRLAAIRIDYLAAVAHELRTPTATLTLLSDVLVRNLDTPDQRAEIAHNLSSATKRLSATVERMLTLQRLNHDGARAKRSNVALRPVMERIGTDLQLTAEHPLIVKADDVTASVDVDLFTTAVVNLIENAQRYGASTTDVTLKTDGSMVELCVMDRGPGVPDSEKVGIFSAFARGEHAKISEATNGLGIGLALVKLFADAHQGTVDVIDRDGGGATFRVRFRGAR